MINCETPILGSAARQINNNLQDAIAHFIDTHGATISDALKAKLGYADTDLLRLWHVNLRYIEYLLSRRYPGKEYQKEPRLPILDVVPFILAIRGWLRQIHLHSAYYKYMNALEEAAKKNNPGGRENLTERHLTKHMAEAQVQSPGANLDWEDKVLRTVIQKCWGQELSSKTVHQKVRNLAVISRMGLTARGVAQKALERIVSAGLAEVVQPDPAGVAIR